MVNITSIKSILEHNGITTRLVNSKELRELFNEKVPEVMAYTNIEEEIKKVNRYVSNEIRMKSEELLGNKSNKVEEHISDRLHSKDILVIETDKPGVLFIAGSSWSKGKLGLKYFPYYRDNIVSEVNKNVTLDNCLNVIQNSKVDYEKLYKEAIDEAKELIETYYKEGDTRFSKDIPMIIKDGKVQSNATDEYITLRAVQEAVKSLDKLMWEGTYSIQDIKKIVSNIAKNI